jgi:hypothetical protein
MPTFFIGITMTVNRVHSDNMCVCVSQCVCACERERGGGEGGGGRESPRDRGVGERFQVKFYEPRAGDQEAAPVSYLTPCEW